MLKAELVKRALPPLPAERAKIKEIICRELFGDLPTPDFTYTVSAPTEIEKRFCCCTVEESVVNMTVSIGGKTHTFPIYRLLHNDGKKRPLVILPNFHPMNASQYFPIEELSEQDVDFLSVFYKDITSDDGDFSTGLSPLLLPNGQDTDTACGKIGVWAWALMRVLDYGLTLGGTDPANIAVAGHSRLGKTALFTGMMDERIRFIFSNAAGCAGDTLAHGNSGFDRPKKTYAKGELIEDIVRNFPYWFCKNYHKYAERSVADCFDQHFLLASIAPRYVLVGSCSTDHWADPEGEQLCCLAASEAWEKAGLSGLVGSDRYLAPGEALLDGQVGFFQIQSFHFLSRHSWARFLQFIEKHKA